VQTYIADARNNSIFFCKRRNKHIDKTHELDMPKESGDRKLIVVESTHVHVLNACARRH
jgi:hypothetical protein